jgi:chondroitin AC lyase
MGDDGLWQDVNHTCYNLMDWQAADHLSRLLFMSMVWSDDTSELCGDNALLRLITRGLDAWYDLSPQNPNWWWMEIGIPQKLAGILLYVSRFCDSSYVERAIPAFVAHEPATRYTGQNLVWVAMIAVSHGVLVEDRELISHGLNLVHRELRIMARSEGLQPDTSFFQHGLLLYSGGYGQSFASLVAQALWIASGTGFEQPDQVEKIELLSRFILDGSRWMIRGSTFDYSAVGREISRAGHSAVNLFHGAAYLAKIDNKRRAELLELADSPKTKSMPLKGNRMFWCADYMTHHRAGYSITVRVPSTRLINVDFACCGGEGRVCHHMAEGATFIYCDGDEYRDIFPVWNWRQVPGTTVEQHLGSLDENKLRHFGNRDFAGGASDGNVGCIAAEISDETLAAHKAWFLFDGGMVALGTAISSSAEVPVRTTIDQCHPRGTLLYDGEPLKDSVTPTCPRSRTYTQ